MSTYLVLCGILQLTVLVYACYHLYKTRTWYIHTNAWASIVTISGVFGTFLGIVIVLQSFDTDPNRMQESIGGVLDGLKFAFLTSVFGIFSAIVLKGGALWFQMHNSGENPSIKAIAKTDNILNSIKTALSSTNDETVFSQLQALQVSIESSNTQLVREISEFSNGIAEKCSVILVEALKGIVRDYNVKINEQFGANFVQFNEAVREMNRYQEQYHQHFHIAVQTVENSSEALESMAGSFTTIADRSQTLISAAETLTPLLDALNGQLNTFSQMHEQALKAFPYIEESVSDLTTEFSDAVQKAVTHSEAGMSKQQEALENHVTQVTKITTRFSETVDEISKVLDAELKRLTNFNLIQDQLTRATERILEKLDELDQKHEI